MGDKKMPEEDIKTVEEPAEAAEKEQAPEALPEELTVQAEPAQENTDAEDMTGEETPQEEPAQEEAPQEEPAPEATPQEEPAPETPAQTEIQPETPSPEDAGAPLAFAVVSFVLSFVVFFVGFFMSAAVLRKVNKMTRPLTGRKRTVKLLGIFGIVAATLVAVGLTVLFMANLGATLNAFDAF